MFCNNKKRVGYLDHENMREILHGFVKEVRYAHTLAMEGEAEKLAGIFDKANDGDFVKKLKSAVILHDMTKEFSKEKHYEVCERYAIKLSRDDMAVEKSLHAKTAAYIAKIEFGADDKNVFWGIYNHTLGGVKNFSLFAKIIYLADYIEPMRDFKDCIDVRDYFCSGIANAHTLEDRLEVLDKTILYSLDITIKSLIDDGLMIHSDAVKCRNSLL